MHKRSSSASKSPTGEVDSDSATMPAGTQRASRGGDNAAPSGFVLLGGVFLVSTVVLLGLLSTFPRIPEEDSARIVLPKSLEDAKGLASVLSQYKDDHSTYVVVAYLAVYIFLQAFAIPGSTFLSILAGALFGPWWGLLAVVAGATLGASACYGLAWYVARGLVQRVFAARLAPVRAQVEANKDHLYHWMLSIRVSPMIPNWLINIGAPIVDIPFRVFFVGSALGLTPAAFICVRAGMIIQDLTSMSEVFNAQTFVSLLGIAVLGVVPSILAKRQKAAAAAAAKAKE